MLKKKNRVSARLVKEIFKRGRSINSSCLSFRFIEEKTAEEPKISFIVPKSVASLASKRNSLRRRGYGALKNHINLFPKGIIGVFLYKKPIETAEKIESEIEFVLGVLKK